MATWIGVVTNAGRALFATWMNGTTFNFDAAEGGTGTTAESALLAQTALVNKKQDISILGGERVTDGIKLTIQITAPATGYTLNQIGIKGSVDGGSRVLTALFQTSDGVTIPSVAQTPDFIYKFFGTITVSNTGEFTLMIDTSAVVSQSTLDVALIGKADLGADGKISPMQLPDMDYVTPEDMTAAIKAHNEDADAHESIRTAVSNAATAAVNAATIASNAAAAASNAQKTADTALEVITKLTHTIDATPTQSGTITYTGSAQSPGWNSYNPEAMTVGGTTSGTNAGTYTATFTPKDGYVWSDGTATARSVTWTIGKAAGSLSLSTTSLSLSNTTPTGTITVTRSGDGTIAATSSNTSAATVSVSGTTVTVTGVADGTATITVSVAAGTNHTAPTSTTASATVTFANVFGVCWKYGSTSTALTRLTKASDPNSLVTVNISTEPSAAVGTVAGSSPFDSYAPWSGMEEYNIISNAVSYKKGDTSFSRTSNDTVVYIPEFYYKIVDDSTNSKRYFYVADKAKTGFTKHPGSGRYVGKYNTGSDYVSMSGLAPLVSITRETARTNSAAKGNNWWQYDIATWNAIQMLYIVEFADWDTQTKIGRGNVDSGAVQTSGQTDSMTYHTGRASGTDGYTAVQYRWIENPWGNVFDFVDGANFSARVSYICTTPSAFADDTTAGYTAAGITLPSSGWPKKMGVSSALPWLLLPDTVGGSDSTYVPDYMYSAAGWRVLCVDGICSNASDAGLFYAHAGYASSTSTTYHGARLLFVP